MTGVPFETNLSSYAMLVVSTPYSIQVSTAELTIYAFPELFHDTLHITHEVLSDTVLWEHLIAKHMTYGLKQSKNEFPPHGTKVSV